LASPPRQVAIKLVGPLPGERWCQMVEGAKTHERQERRAFSYVGACQVLMGLYIFFFRGLSRLVRSAQSLFLKEQSERSNTSSLLVPTSKAPRGAQSAIRAREDLPPAHEISCASDDAHSRSR